MNIHGSSNFFHELMESCCCNCGMHYCMVSIRSLGNVSNNHKCCISKCKVVSFVFSTYMFHVVGKPCGNMMVGSFLRITTGEGNCVVSFAQGALQENKNPSEEKPSRRSQKLATNCINRCEHPEPKNQIVYIANRS